jgi:hypothetical protein
MNEAKKERRLRERKKKYSKRKEHTAGDSSRTFW